jgi:hypothetical protein
MSQKDIEVRRMKSWKKSTKCLTKGPLTDAPKIDSVRLTLEDV